MATGYLYYMEDLYLTLYHSTKYKCKGREGKATFNRVNICTNQNETLMKQIHNSQKSIGNPYQPMDFLNPEKKMCEPKIYRLLPNICDLHTKIHRLAYRF
jgi:hypothetical protein